MLSYIRLIDGTEIIGERIAIDNYDLFMRYPLSLEREETTEGKYTGFNNLIPLQFDEIMKFNNNNVIMFQEITSPSMAKLYKSNVNQIFQRVHEQSSMLLTSLENEELEMENKNSN